MSSMSNVSTEQRLRLVQQVRSRYNENRYDMYNRERILYGRASYPEELEPGDQAVAGMGPMDPSMPVSGFCLRCCCLPQWWPWISTRSTCPA